MNRHLSLRSGNPALTKNTFSNFTSDTTQKMTLDNDSFFDDMITLFVGKGVVAMSTDEEILQRLKQIQEGSGFETTKFELKETFWYDVNKSKGAGRAIRNFKLEYEVVNEVCALLNTSGGYVLIGVTDDGIVKGITEERDLQWMKEGEKDLDHFADMISRKLEVSYFQDSITSKYVTVKPRIIEEKPIIIIEIKKSSKPWFVHRKGIFKDKNGIERFLRGGTDESEFMEYFIRRETGATNVPIDELLDELR